MGYSCNLKSNKNIKELEIQKIVDNLPGRFRSVVDNKQEWGWLCACNIHKPKGDLLTISGSYGISRDISEEFVNYIKTELEGLDHKIKIMWNW